MNLEHPDIVEITGNLYCKTPEALDFLLSTLRENEYSIKNLRESRANDNFHSNVTVEQMERDGWSLWYASMPDTIRKAKCGSCGGYVSTRGCKAHGTKCSLCGEVLHYDIIDGSIIRFMFPEQEYTMTCPQMRMKAKSWDDETGELLLYLDEDAYVYRIGVTEEDPKEILAQFSDCWEPVEQDDVRYIKVIKTKDYDPKVSINTMDIHGHYHNSNIVNVYKGKEYSEWNFGREGLPIPESISIYETWHWAPLPPSEYLFEKIMRAAGQVSRKEYGSYSVSGVPVERMSKFIEHFTELDHKEFERRLPLISLQCPDFIDELCDFCDGKSVRNRRAERIKEIDKMNVTPRGGVRYYYKDGTIEEIYVPGVFLESMLAGCSEGVLED